MVDTRLTHFEKATRLKTNKNKMKNAVVLPAHVVVERALQLEDARCTSFAVFECGLYVVGIIRL